MRSFPSTELKRLIGDVLDAASREPVAITKHNKPRYILMSVHDYERRFPKDERRAYAADEMPDEHLTMLESALAELEEPEKP
ncbi:Prevent-host-death family protein [uncultured Pleomorphomonas sp.]|uniref:Antitoxin n=1 Tax=uncultured Pleomorphomonas sp. TaxID=442121 RepID=A0A212LCE9_9HYPH|nr:type II toxin-antitoxin system Phd/YefM family antitoxin [uncultured Pleomorphomonas sp.]SCM75236.1 Prevent-host-death family protein [uncultured Pleomorphomonas sp.]